jgi:glycosyltransferase involved in cell wall biosynthesis
MDEERFYSVVVSLKDRGNLRQRIETLGVPVYSVAMRLAVPTPTSIFRLIRLVRNLKPDVIQGWLPHGNLAAQLAGAFSGPDVSVLWNIRQSLYSLQYEKWTTAAVIRFGARLSNKPAGMIFNSRTSAAQHGAIGYRMGKTLVIPNGFDTELFAPSELARRSVRSELGVSEDAVFIGLIGRYHPMKDHANFLRAASLVHRSHPEVHFVLAGRLVSNDNNTLRKLVEELGLSHRAHLLGERQDMPRITAALDIAASASYYGEGFPNVIGEAMACGVPCVATDISDLPWVVGDAGRVVPPRDPAAMAEALDELLHLGPDGRAALGRAARSRVIEYFQLDSVVEHYESVYEAVRNRTEVGRLKADVRYQRLLELIPSTTQRHDARRGAADVGFTLASRPKR